MDRRDDSLYPPGQMISDVDPHGIPVTQDGFYTYEYCRLVGDYYRHRYAQAQDYQHLNNPWQQNHRLQLLQLQPNLVNSDVACEVLGDEEEGSLDDLASEDGMENNDAWEEDQLHDSGMYEVGDSVTEYQVSWEDMHSDDGTEIQSDLENDESVIPWLINMYMWVPQDGANEGLQEDAILKNLKTRRYVKDDDESEMCVVCQLEYEDKETLGILGCGHEYHADCIKRWLVQKNVCPLCKQTGIVL